MATARNCNDNMKEEFNVFDDTLKSADANEITKTTKMITEMDPTKQLIVQGELIKMKQSTIKNIPYFETLFSNRFQSKKSKDGIIETNDLNPVFVKIIITSLESDSKFLNELLSSLPRDEDLVKFFETLQYLCLEPPRQFLECENINKHLCHLRNNDLLFYIATPFAYYIFEIYHLKIREIDEEETNQLFNWLLNILLTKGLSVKANNHLMRLSLQLLPLTNSQQEKIRDTEHKKFNCEILRAVHVYSIDKNKNLFLLLQKSESSIELFEALKFFVIDLPFDTAIEEIKKLFKLTPKDFGELNEVNKVARFAYYIYIRKIILERKMIDQIFHTTGYVLSHTHDFGESEGSHLKEIVLTYCQLSVKQKKALKEGVGTCFKQPNQNKDCYDDDYDNFDEYFSDYNYSDCDDYGLDLSGYSS